MGSYISHRMDVEEPTGTSSDESSISSIRSHDDSDQETELEAVLQFLLRSGQVHIIASDYEEDEVNQPPKISDQFNTSLLEKSEYTVTTKQASGLVRQLKCRRQRKQSLITMIQNRERGIYANGSFSSAIKCNISNRCLPNQMIQVARHPGKAYCGTYSKDGSYFVSACQDYNIRYYNTSDEKFTLIKTIPGREVGWSIIDMACSPDGQHLVYSSWSDALHIFRLHGDTNNHEALRLNPPDQQRFCMFSVEFSSDGHEIVGGANDGNIYVYDRERNQRSLRVAAHDDDTNSVVFADSTSQILYSGGDDGLAKVWDRRTLNETDPKPVGVLAGHMDGITFIDSRGDGRYLISNSKDQSIKLWDIRVFSGNEAQTNTLKAVNQQAWDYRWQDVPTSFYDPKSKLKGDTSIMTYRGHSVLKTLVRCRFSPPEVTGQRYIYTGCAAGRVVIYDSLTGKAQYLSGHRGCVRDVSWHPHRQEIASSCWDGVIGVWKRVVPDSLDSNESDDRLFYGELKRGPAPLRRSLRIAKQRRRAMSQDSHV